MKSVYLAGPISGLGYREAQRWRSVVADSLAPHIECYSPLRCKDFLIARGVLEGTYDEHPLSTARGILTRDHNDTFECNVLFVNLLGATTRVSIGTVMEIAWAHAYRKPIVLLMEETGNIHDHPMITEAVSYRVSTMAKALEVTRAILLPRVSPPRFSNTTAPARETH